MQAVEPGIQGVEKPLFIFLHVFVVGQRQSFQRHHHAGQGTLHAAAFATDKLQASGFFFCGISEEPEVTRSESSTKFASPELKKIRSSAKRDRCTIPIAASESSSST